MPPVQKLTTVLPASCSRCVRRAFGNSVNLWMRQSIAPLKVPWSTSKALRVSSSAIDVDYLVGKRVDPSSFDLSIRADKIRDDLGNRLTDVQLTFDLTFPEGADGDRAKEILPRAVAQSHDRICTVTRTVIVGTPVESVIAD